MYDVLILGAGAAGLTAAVYAARAGLTYLVLERDGWGGGQITSAHQVQNYPGLPDATGYELGEKLRAHAVSLGAEIQYAKIKSVARAEDGFAVSTDSGVVYEAKTVIAATGASPRALGAAGEAEHVGSGVSYCAVCDGAFFKGKSVLVVGGGDTAVEDALYLATICTHVTVAIRRDQFRAARTRVEKLKTLENVTILINTQVAEIRGEGRVSSVVLKNGDGMEEKAVDGVFIAVGIQPSTEYLAELPVLTPEGYVLADETGATGVPGLFAAGDIRKKALRQVVTAVADGANAAVSAAAYLNERTGPLR